MGFLSDEFKNEVMFKNHRYKINPAFDIILEIQNLYKEELPDYVKAEQALKMLIKNKRTLPVLSIVEKAELLEMIFRQCIGTKERPKTRQSLPVLDFEEDGEYIYASFMYDYRIDLRKEQGRLPWRNFIALFQGLSEQTKIREVMRIRQMEIPEYNGKNSKQIQQIQELKSFYALPVKGNPSGGLDALFSKLEAQAVRK